MMAPFFPSTLSFGITARMGELSERECHDETGLSRSYEP